MLTKEHLENLVCWAESKGFSVFFEKDGGNDICFESKSIEIKSTKSLEEKIYILSHECGHILANKKKKYNHPKSEKIERIAEEISAWEKGEKILIKLNVPYDLNSFEEQKYTSLDKYCKKYPKF